MHLPVKDQTHILCPFSLSQTAAAHNVYKLIVYIFQNEDAYNTEELVNSTTGLKEK